MGNEMGNNNTSGLREEDDTRVEAQGWSQQEAGNANGAKGESHAAPAPQSKEYHEKSTGFCSDEPVEAGDTDVHSQTPNGRVEPYTPVEQQETGADSAAAETISNDAALEDRDTRPSTLPKELEDLKNPTELNLDEKPLETRNFQLERQTSFWKADEKELLVSTFVTVPSSVEPEPMDSVETKLNREESTEMNADQSPEPEAQDPEILKLDQHESEKVNAVQSPEPESQDSLELKLDQHHYEEVHAHQSLQNGSNLTRGAREILGSSVACASKENGHQLDTSVTNNVDGAVLSGSNLGEEQKRDEFSLKEMASEEDKILSEGKIELGNRIGNGLRETTVISLDLVNDVREQPNGEFTSDMSCPGHNSLESQPEPNLMATDMNCQGSDSLKSQPEAILMPNSPNYCPVASETKCLESEALEFEPEDNVMAISPSAMATDMNCHENESLESQPDANLMATLLDSQPEVPLPEDKAMILSEETELIRTESESEETRHEHNLNQFSLESIGESGTGEGNPSKTASLTGPSGKDKEKNCLFSTSHDAASNGYRHIEEEKVADLINMRDGNQNDASAEYRKESNGKSMIVSELVILPAEFSLSTEKNNEDEAREWKGEKVEKAEKHIAGEINEKTEALYVTVNDAEESGSGQLSRCQSLPIQVEGYLPSTKASLFEPQDQQKTARGYEASQESSESEQEENCNVLFNTLRHTVQAANSLTVETLVSAVDLEVQRPDQEVSGYLAGAPDTGTETKTEAETKSSASTTQSSEQCQKVEMPVFGSGDYEAEENVGRPSIESNPDYFNIHAQMRKSPSFNLDLRIEARREESDRTPLLYQDKTTLETSSSQANYTNLQNPLLHSQHDQDPLQYQAMPVEEKVITLERSDSEKSRTPFLGFLKEDEESKAEVKQKKQDNHSAAKNATKDLWNPAAKELSSTSPTKGKEKHKRRTSLFGSCMCCATVIN